MGLELQDITRSIYYRLIHSGSRLENGLSNHSILPSIRKVVLIQKQTNKSPLITFRHAVPFQIISKYFYFTIAIVRVSQKFICQNDAIIQSVMKHEIGSHQNNPKYKGH